GRVSMKQKKCAYCGTLLKKYDREHVFPKCLYPLSKAKSKVQRLTVPACNMCNNGWADDEAHFRNVLLVSGDPNKVVRELWETTAIRSFHEIDGRKRIADLMRQMRSISTSDGTQTMIFPGKDNRVTRVLRKIVRGLCYYHQLTSPILDDKIWVDTFQHAIPQQFLDQMEHHHREEDIVKYSFHVVNESGISSAWIITFFERTTFLAIVNQND
ncbi:MAG TPA: hypothetical protein VFS21_10900, partial [Roseiflexaceae bacterium]|nr:hypothetical protein [Roseiflexaceae bacterium]